MDAQLDQNQIMQALSQAFMNVANSQKQYGGFTPYGLKAAGTPSENAYLYESGGLFGRCDGPMQLINALVGPVGFEKVLRWIPSVSQNEFVDAWTSVSETGSEQTAACGDCISVALTACAQHYCFGRFCRQTNELQFDRLGVMANNNVPKKALFGNLTDANGNILLRQGEIIDDAFVLQAASVGYTLRLKNATMLWTGNPTNNNGQVYMEYGGFQTLVNTGKYDAYTQIPCDGLDSYLLDYGNNLLASDGTYSINDWFRRMVLQFMRRAEGAGMDWESANMYIVMSPNMWDGVAKRYACAGIDLCNVTATNNEVSASADQAQMRYEEYLTRQALPIYGRWYPVVIDSQVPESTGQPNGVCSDIYFITTAINGEEITFGQYQDFNQTYGSVRDEMVRLFGSDDIAITDNGRYALVRDNSRGCFDLQTYMKPRIVMKMPQLSGRIQNVCHNILGGPVPAPTASGSIYEVGGGRSITSIPTLYGDC